MNSPITGGVEVSLNRKIPTQYIIQNYLESYNIDVSRILGDRQEIKEYKCEKSRLRFYGPDQLAGDSKFYEELQEFPWYYMDWKWEHAEVQQFITPGSKILELGCAEGSFLEHMPDSIECTGLELNKNAAELAREKGLDVHNETIQDHATSNEGKYDVVVSFQVMEHVTDVQDIIKASLKCLKPGGRLIFSVPNNDSFIKHSPDSILNMPPHHMNLWDEESLSRLPEFFDMEMMGCKYEPLQPYHFPVVVNNFIERRLSRGIVGKVLKKFIKWTQLYKVVGLFATRIKGHSIIAFYSKRA